MDHDRVSIILQIQRASSTNFISTYPTTYLNFPALYYNTATMTTVSNKIICTTARRTIFLHTPYAIRPDDKDYFYIFTNMGHAITYLDKIPGGVPSSLGPDFASCSLGPNQGIPTTKIAIFATQSTVYQYKTGERKPSSSAEGNLPVINPPAPPSKPINTPLSTTNVVVVPQPTRTLPTEQTGQHPPPLTSITSAPQPPAITPPPIFIPSADSYRVLPSVAGVVLPNGATLLAGKATTISDTPYSLYSSANQLSLIIGGRTLALQPSRPLQLPTGYQLLPSGGGLILPNGETLKPGSATIVNGIPNSLAPSASFVVVGGVTMTPLSGSGLPSGYSMLGPGDGIGLPNGETLRPGAGTTVGGVLVSLDASNSVLVYGSTTISPSSSTGETIGAVKSAGKTSSISAGGRLEVVRVVLLLAIVLLTSIFVD